MKTMRSRGITIFSLAEIVLGGAGIAFAVWSTVQFLMLYEPDSTNVSLGFALMFAVSSYVVSLPLFIAGILMYRLRPAGRIISICWLVFFIPLSIPFLFYLFQKGVKAQFAGPAENAP